MNFSSSNWPACSQKNKWKRFLFYDSKYPPNAAFKHWELGMLLCLWSTDCSKVFLRSPVVTIMWLLDAALHSASYWGRFVEIKNTGKAGNLDELRMKYLKNIPNACLFFIIFILLLISRTGDLQVKSHFPSPCTKFIFGKTCTSPLTSIELHSVTPTLNLSQWVNAVNLSWKQWL